MKRCAFMSLLGGAAAAWPLAARAQQQAQRVRRIGMLGDHIAGAQRRAARRLPQGPRELDYVEGQTYAIQSGESLCPT